MKYSLLLPRLLLFTISFHLLCFFHASAHSVGQNYIYFRIYEKNMAGRFEVNVNDVNKILESEIPDRPEMDQVAPYLPSLQEYILKHTSFSANEANLPIEYKEVEILHTNAGTFLLLHFIFDESMAPPEEITIRSEMLFDKEPAQQCWLMIEYNWKAGIYNNEAIPSLIFDSDHREQSLSLAEFSVMKGFLAMVYQGMKHIWIGLDHILFLLALLLPAVLSRQLSPEEETFAEKVAPDSFLAKLSPGLRSWWPLPEFRSAFINVVKVVTFFTIAHTITLSIAALGILDLPGRWVESIIAFSIALAAYHNVRPIFHKREWLIVFGFGLFHGFGFASVLGDIGIGGEFLVLTLLGFNLGVEIGQIVIICLLFPVLFFIRRLRIFPGVLIYGSIFLIIVSLYWFVGRVFDLEVYGEDLIIDVYSYIRPWFV